MLFHCINIGNHLTYARPSQVYYMWLFLCFFFQLQVLILRNHGIVICGSSVEESFHLAFNTMSAVDVQVFAY